MDDFDLKKLWQSEYKLYAAIGGGLVLLLFAAQFHGGQARAVFIGLAAGAGCLVSWMSSSEGRRLRGVMTWTVFALGVLLSVSIDDRQLSPYLTIAVCVFAFIVAASSGRSKKRGRSVAFGSAEWATLDHMRARGLLGRSGLRLGGFEGAETGERVVYVSDRHLLTIAPTRSGKGVSAIIPNLLTYEGSALVIDPKGENAMITAGARAAMGQRIHVVDPWLIAPSASTRPSRFNPLDWLVKGDSEITENAMLLADALVMPQSEGDRFWVEEAKALLQGLILYVATDEREEGARDLGRVRDLLLLDDEDMPALFQRMTQSAHHIVASTGARCLQKDPKLLSNVIASAQAETHFLNGARIRESLSVSDFKFEDLKSGAVTIYLVLPADRLNAFGRWLRLLIQQAITVSARNVETKPKRPVLFLLDEMPALGRLSMLEQAFGLMAGFGMQLWGIVQDVSQLKRVYGEGWETFIGNSGAIQYFGSRDRMTAEYFSALCGVTTVENVSFAFGRSAGASGSSNSTTETSSSAQRKLAFPDELMRLHGDRQLILIENGNPIIGTKLRWFEDAELAAKGRALAPQLRLAA